MSYTYKISETLTEINKELYKTIEIKIFSIDSKFTVMDIPFVLKVEDNVNEVSAFMTFMSGNEKELFTYFTVDAFINFSTNSDIKFGYGNNFENVIENVNVHNLDILPALLESIPHEIADNAWLQSVQ